MDAVSSKKLEEVLSKGPELLSEEEKGFLRARASYLTDEQAKAYAAVIGDAPEAPVKKAVKKK